MGSSSAERLREHRARANLTQEQLAVHAGVTAKTIQNIEAGRGRPHRGTLMLLAHTLDCELTDLEPEDEQRAAAA